MPRPRRAGGMFDSCFSKLRFEEENRIKKIYMYLPDTMADWEGGYFLQGFPLQKMLPEQEYGICTVAASKSPIRTAGGVTLVPDRSLDELDEKDAAALLLIGTDAWADPSQAKILELALRPQEKGVIVAAICGATLGLANLGVLDTRDHASNALLFLKSLSADYKGESYYKDECAVTDGNPIAASSGSLLWARYILERFLEVYSAETIEAWYQYFYTGKAEYFAGLMHTF